MSGRIYWIDYAKFIGIFLVVLGHTEIPAYAVNFIYAFHMPLFFCISGYLFDPAKFSSFSAFAKHRFRQLIIPYFFLNIITYFFWLFIGRKFGTDAASGISPLTPLTGIIYGTDTNDYLVHCGSLWFLPCLFVTEILYFLAAKKLNSFLLLALIIICGYLNLILPHALLPWSIDAALVALFFYASGNIFKTHIHSITLLKPWQQWSSCLLAFLLLAYLSYMEGRADMSSNTYTNYSLFLFTAICGIYFAFSKSIILQALFGKINWIDFFAVSTLTILAFHSIAGSILKGIGYFIFKVPTGIYNHQLLLNVFLTLLIFITLAPVIYIINRYLPFLIGRRARQPA